MGSEPWKRSRVKSSSVPIISFIRRADCSITPSFSRALSLIPSSRRSSPRQREHRAHRVAQVVPEDAHHALPEGELARQLVLRLLQLGHVDSRAGDPHDTTDVAQGLIADQEVATRAGEDRAERRARALSRLDDAAFDLV